MIQVDKLLSWQRRFILMVVDAFIILSTFLFSFSVVFTIEGALSFLLQHANWILLAMALRVVSYYGVGMYTFLWRYASTREFTSIVRGATLGSLCMALALFFSNAPLAFPRSILVVEWGFSIIAVGSIRVALRLYRDKMRARFIDKDGAPIRRVVIIGAGAAGDQIARELVKSTQTAVSLIGFLDDDPALKDQRIYNIPVLGSPDTITTVAKKYSIEEAFIAMPSVSGQRIRALVHACEVAGVQAKTLPGLHALLGGTVSVSQLRDVRIEDLLRRDVVELDTAAIATYLSGQVVLVTGAGGSIGSELCRQIMSYAPKTLVLVDHSEFAMYTIDRDLRGLQSRTTLVSRVVSVCQSEQLEAIFKQVQPNVVFHAAAYKHVPLMEENPEALVFNNVKGTQVVFDLSLAYKVKKVVLVSTDKAVNPTNCMGASKRVCEMLLQAYHSHSNTTSFSAVRFGNVLGSQGSVVPLFKQQIAAGGPITLTHPDITRYFMTIPEAVGLVLQTGSLSKGGEIFILDMGEPIKIKDLAYDLIRLSGLAVGTDIEVVSTGLRPGEKMYEELSYNPKALQATTHAKIALSAPILFNKDQLKQQVADLLTLREGVAIRKALFQVIGQEVRLD